MLNEWEEVTIEWIPGHRNIEGNKRADKVAKGMRERRLDKDGRWMAMDYKENSKTSLRMWKEEEWKVWHKKPRTRLLRTITGETETPERDVKTRLLCPDETEIRGR